MLDLSLEAIEADLTLAEVHAGRPLERIALARAQITATLMAADVRRTIDIVPTAPVKDWNEPGYLDNNVEPQEDPTVAELDEAAALPPLEIESDGLEADFDVFAEARKARKK